MNDLEKKLVIIYTIISIILMLISVLIAIWDDIKKGNKETLKLFLLGLILLPIIGFGMFAVFVNIYGFAEWFVKDDFIVVQILTNIPNFYGLYYIIKEFKENNTNN